jgi:protein-S-isoprenylcysteine O-methyltransferase Ste14
MHPYFIYLNLIGVLWIAWLAYWGVASIGTKTTVRVQRGLARTLYLVPLILAALLLFEPLRLGAGLDARIYARSPEAALIGLVVVAAGLAYAVWARLHLGTNWSGEVTVKQDHELIRSGPYRLVRHPIYTGLTLALIGTAIAVGTWRGVIAVILAAASFWWKLKLEERWMVETFGEDYRRYQSQTAALIPYLL